MPDPSPEDEAAIVARARAGDRDAFGVLVDRYQVAVRRVTRAVLHDAEEADDAAQDAFLSVLTKLEQYDQGRPFRPWLMRIAANVAIDRKRRRQVRRGPPLGEGGGAEATSFEPSPQAHAERSALRERLEAALRHLPERYRVALVLYDVEGYSHPEIAEILGIPVGTVRSAVFHARRTLRPLLEGWRDDR